MEVVERIIVILGDYQATLPNTSNGEIIAQCLGDDHKTITLLTFPETSDKDIFLSILQGISNTSL